MNYGNIKSYDIADGTGVRVSLFVSGCRHHCKGCFNAPTWDFNYGKPFTRETQDKLLELLAPSYIEGFSLLGGEPFEPENQPVLAELLEEIRRTFPDKSICVTVDIFLTKIWFQEVGSTLLLQTGCSPASTFW